MHSTIDISVIIPIYGVERYIERCARSLFDQTLQDRIEFIFVNDSTKDRSITILENVIKSYPNRKNQILIIHHPTNKGLASARMSGFFASRGKYIIHCDSDDWVERNIYEILLTTAVKTNSDIVSCGYIGHLPHNKQILRLYPYDSEGMNEINKSYPDLLYCAVWNKLIKRDLYTLNNVNWYPDINMYEDVGVTTRLRALSSRTTIVNMPLYHYNLENINSMGRCPSLRSIEEQIKCAELLSKWHSSAENINISLFLYKIKFYAKMGLVIFPDTFNPERWRYLFKETNGMVGSIGNVAVYNRLALFLVKLRMDKVAYALVKLKKHFSYRG